MTKRLIFLSFDSITEAWPGGAVTVGALTRPISDIIVDRYQFSGPPDAFQLVERPRRGDLLRAQQAITMRVWLTRPLRVQATLYGVIPHGHLERTCPACGRRVYSASAEDLDHECNTLCRP